MDLHRPDGTSDWEAVQQSDRNNWQRLAARTNGIATPGNLLTIVGFLGTIGSLYLLHKHYYWSALIVIAVARFFDILDGLVADKTGTKSSLGANLDAGFDKLATVVVPVSFVILRIVPIWAAIVLLLPHLVITYVGYLGLRRRHKILPSQLGKLSMAAAWVSLLCFVLASALNTGGVRLIADGLVLLSAAMGSITAVQYVRELRAKA